MKLVCISDTHDQLSEINLPSADILIIAGDVTRKGTIEQINKFNEDLGKVKDNYKAIILVGGNHDKLFEKDPVLAKSLLTNVTHYLQDDLVEIDGIKFYGAPWVPNLVGWAFFKSKQDLKAKWDLIPEGIDVLITHSPPHGILDVSGLFSPNYGCQELLKAVMRVKPKYHVFGHIHNGAGIKEFNGIIFVNAAICDEQYDPINKPILIEINNT